MIQAKDTCAMVVCVWQTYAITLLWRYFDWQALFFDMLDSCMYCCNIFFAKYFGPSKLVASKIFFEDHQIFCHGPIFIPSSHWFHCSGLILLVHLANPLLPAHSFKPANPLQPITPSSQQICHRQFIPLSPVHQPRIKISLSPAIHPFLQVHIVGLL